MDTANRIIYASLALLALIGMTGFFVTPQYEKGVAAVIAAVVATLTGACGFKFGVTTAQNVNRPASMELLTTAEDKVQAKVQDR